MTCRWLPAAELVLSSNELTSTIPSSISNSEFLGALLMRLACTYLRFPPHPSALFVIVLQTFSTCRQTPLLVLFLTNFFSYKTYAHWTFRLTNSAEHSQQNSRNSAYSVSDIVFIFLLISLNVSQLESLLVSAKTLSISGRISSEEEFQTRLVSFPTSVSYAAFLFEHTSNRRIYAYTISINHSICATWWQ